MRLRIRAHAGRWVASLCLILVIDALYFSALGALVYPPDALDVSWRHAALAYLVISLGLSSIEVHKSSSVALCGLLVGAFVYGVFNGTEMAIRRDWRQRALTPLVDTLYGSLLCSVVLTATSRLGSRLDLW